MYILVNSDNIIVGSAVNKPSTISCSKRGQKIFQIPDEEFDPSIIGSELVSYDTVEVDRESDTNV